MTIRFRSEHAENIAERLSESRRVLEYLEDREKIYRVSVHGKMSLLRVCTLWV
ncbi:MAG: hypothetical protein GXY48_04605 [Methanomicrobiales archaeon]|nr:hypothetical protein [Methanomicrobiales archaeon]